MKNYLNNFYHQFHENNGKYGFVHHLTGKTKYFQQEIGENKKILDLGCRDGSMTKIFAGGNSLTCLDVDEYACRLCTTNIKAEVICHDLNDHLPFADESYDVVVLSDVLEHVFLSQSLIAEINRVLKVGGLFLGSTPNAYRWNNRAKMMCGIDVSEYMDETHVHFFSLDSLKRLLYKFFDEVEITSYGKNPLINFWPEMLADDFFWKSIKKERRTE